MPYTSTYSNEGYQVVHTIEGDTEADVDEGVQALMDRYHPLGYGTRVTIPAREVAGGRWQAQVKRDASAGG